MIDQDDAARAAGEGAMVGSILRETSPVSGFEPGSIGFWLDIGVRVRLRIVSEPLIATGSNLGANISIPDLWLARPKSVMT